MTAQTQHEVCVVGNEALSVPAVDPWGGHQLLVCERDNDTELGRWAANGLVRGDKLLYAATDRFPDEGSLTAMLSLHGVDAADDGRIEVVAAAQFYDVEGYERIVEQSLGVGHGGVRSFGGPHVAAGVLDAAGFAEFERLLERMWTTRGASAACCYPATRDDVLGEGVGRHESAWRHQLLHVRQHGHGYLSVHGEVDSSNDDLFGAVLSAAADRARSGDSGRWPLLVLDCAGLGYVSVSGWRAAVAGTEGFRGEGGRVVLTGLARFAVRVLHATGFSTAFELPDGDGATR